MSTRSRPSSAAGASVTTGADRKAGRTKWWQPLEPFRPGWVLVDGLSVFHRYCVDAGDDAPAMVHVHGFAISGRYLEPTAALLARRCRTFVRLSVLPHVDIVTVAGAHALNFSSPQLIAELVEAHLRGDPLVGGGRRSVVEQITVDVPGADDQTQH